MLQTLQVFNPVITKSKVEDVCISVSGQKTVSQACAREKRDAGLIPFPRVGRTFPLTWSFLPLFEPESGERQSMY